MENLWCMNNLNASEKAFLCILPLLTHSAAEVICKILHRTIKHSEKTPGIIVHFLRGFSSRTATLELTALHSTIVILFWILSAVMMVSE